MEDVETELHKMPAPLNDQYQPIVDKIHQKPERARIAAVATFQWILGSRVMLPCEEILTAVGQASKTELTVH